MCGSSAEVQLKIHWSIFNSAILELLRVYFRYTLSILHLKTDIIKWSILINRDIKTHFKHNIKKCALEILQVKFNFNFISVSKWYVNKYVNGFEVYLVKNYILYIYTAAQKFGISKILMFFKGVSSAHQGCIYSIKNTEKTVIFWNLIAISNIGFLF